MPVMKPNESRLTGSLGFQRGGTMKERQNKSGALSPDRSLREIRTPSHASVLLPCAIIAGVSVPDSLHSIRRQLISARSSRPGRLHYLLSCIVLQQNVVFWLRSIKIKRPFHSSLFVFVFFCFRDKLRNQFLINALLIFNFRL